MPEAVSPQLSDHNLSCRLSFSTISKAQKREDSFIVRGRSRNREGRADAARPKPGILAPNSCRLIAVGYKGYSNQSPPSSWCLTTTQKGSADFYEVSISAIFVYCPTLILSRNQQIYFSERNGVRANSLMILGLHSYGLTTGLDSRLSRNVRRVA